MHVDPVGRERVGDRSRHRTERAEVEDELGAGDRPRDRVRIRERPDDQLGVGVHVLLAAVRQIVEHADLVPGLDERVDEVRTDEPGAPGDEHGHEGRTVAYAD